MLFIFQRLFGKEYQQFKKLSNDGQRLLAAIFSYNFIHPIFALFINAFLWRQTQSIELVALYNLAFYALLPVGFYLNGYFLKHSVINLLQAYTFGAVTRAFSIFFLIFWPYISPSTIVLFGAIYGLCSGLYWSNRNLLTIKATQSNNRIYFTSIDLIMSSLTNILVPLLVGAFIMYGKTINLYTPIQAYYVVAAFLIMISLLSGWQLRNIKTQPVVNQIILHHPSRHWKQSRIVLAFFGLLNGTFQFLSVLMVLAFVGKEDALGTVQALSAVISAIILYLIARKVTPKQRIWILASGVLLLILGGGIFEVFYSSMGVFLFMAFFSLAQPLLLIAINSLNFDVIDKETMKTKNDYAYVFDSELYLNIGRVIGVVIFLWYVNVFSSDFALRMTPLIFGVAQIILLLVAQSSHKKQRATQLAIRPTD